MTSSAELHKSKKKCNHCQKWKDYGHYWRNRRAADGLQKRCKECQRKLTLESVARRSSVGPPPEKRCPQCEKIKPSTDFYQQAGRGDYLSPYCKSCTNKYALELRKKHPKRNRAYSLKRYGIDLEGYDRLHALQDGKCAICGMIAPTLNIDHCHATGAIRGLLCGQCNNGLGCYDDNDLLLSRAIEYLRWWQKCSESEIYEPPESFLRNGGRGLCHKTGIWSSQCCGLEAEASKGQPFPFCSGCGSPAKWAYVRPKTKKRRGARPGWRDSHNEQPAVDTTD